MLGCVWVGRSRGVECWVGLLVALHILVVLGRGGGSGVVDLEIGGVC